MFHVQSAQPPQADPTQAVQYFLHGEGLDLPYNEVIALIADYEETGRLADNDPAQAATDIINWMNDISA